MPATIHDHFINKSLLASLDAQAESDPDSTEPYHQPADTLFPVYSSQDYPTDIHFRQSKMNAAYSASYSASFTSYPNTTRSRHHASQSNNSYRDFYPSQDVFPSQITSPVVSHMQPYERTSYDYPSQQPAINGAHNKSPYILDPYGAPKSSSQQQQQAAAQQQSYPFTNGVQLASQTPYGPHIPTSANTTAPGLTTSVSLAMANAAGPTTTTANGEEISTIFVVGFPEDMQEREFQNMFTFSPGFEAATLKIPNKEYTAYNALIGGPPSLSTNGPQQQRNYSASNDPYNLVTVNQGGVLVDGGRDGSMSSWPAPPPSNANDDLAAHYTATNLGLNGLNGAPSSSSTLPPRKQIIGFAKFRSRDEALVARDVLQGRRVDIEKGAVLKAEMAKKNLHTKRGVGPLPGTGPAIGPVGTVLGVVPPGGVLGPPGSQQDHPLSSSSHFADPFGAIINGDRLPGASGQRAPKTTMSLGESEVFMRGARARAEEDERERELLRERERGMSVSGSMGLDGLNGLTSKEKERERDVRLMRLRASNSVAFDAFHGVVAGSPSVAPSVPTAISRQSSTTSVTASISSGSMTGSGLWASPTTMGTDPQSLNSVMEKDDETDEDELNTGERSYERYHQDGAQDDAHAQHELNAEDRAGSAQVLHEPTSEDETDQELEQPHHGERAAQQEIADAYVNSDTQQRQDPDEAADRRQSQVHSHSTHREQVQDDEIVAPWDRITTYANPSGGANISGMTQNGVSYAAVARPNAPASIASGPQTSGSERSTSPVGFLDAQQQHGGYQQQQPTGYMNQYQHLQYHHDMQAQRLAQQQQQQQQAQWPSQFQQQQQGWPTQQQLSHHQHGHHQQQQQWPSQHQQYRSTQSESSETSAIGSVAEASGPGPIGYVGSVSVSGLAASRAGLGLGVNTTGIPHINAFGNLNSTPASGAASANGIERLDDLTKGTAPAPSSSMSSSSSMSISSASSLASVVSGNAGGSSPLPPPPLSGGSMSSATSSSTPTSGSGSNGATSGGGSGGNTSPQLPSPASGSTTSATSAAGVRGTVDQNPPINTLYVGNLPTSPPPMGYPNDYLEETLRETFSVRPGFRKLCFRHKANGPMCFVEFEDVQYATKALVEMSGNTLRGTVKNGIRLSYSKNPLGVRTPTSAGGSGSSGGPTLLQQQQLMQTLSNHHMYQHQQHSGGMGQGLQDSFQSRLSDDFGGHPHHRLPPTLLRRDSALSPTATSSQAYGASNGVNGNVAGGSFFSSPPPRFYTTSPGTNIAFGPSLSSGSASSTQLTGASSAFVPRSAAALNAAATSGNGNGNGMGGMFNASNGVGGGYASLSQAGFSPFGVPFDNSPFAPVSSQQQQQQLSSFMPQQHSEGQHQHHQQSDD